MRALAVVAVLGSAAVPSPPTDDEGVPGMAGEPATLETLRAYVADQRFAAAENLGRRLLADLERAHGRDSPATVDAILPLVEALNRLKGLERDPEILARRAVRITERLGTDDLRHAESLRVLGLVLLYDRPAEARSLLERSLTITERAVGPDHAAVAGALMALARLARRVGDLTTARSLLERTVAIRRTALGPENRETAVAIRQLAITESMAGDLVEAKELAEQALAIQTRLLGTEHPDIADTCNTLGVINQDLGEFVAARRLHERALSIRERCRHPETGSSLNNLADVLLQTGDFSGARRLLEEAWANHPPEKRYHVTFMAGAVNYSEALIGLGEYAQAEAILRRAIDVCERGTNQRVMASGLRLLSTALGAQGNMAGARETQEHALTTLEAALGPLHPRVALFADDLGVLLQEVGDLDGARREYERALDIRKRVLGPTHPDVARSLNHIAGLAWGTGDVETALADAVRAEVSVRDHLVRMARGLSEREALAYEAVRSSGLDVALSVLSANPNDQRRESVMDQVIRSRALVLDEIARRHRGVLEADSLEVKPLVETLDRARVRLARWIVRAGAQDDSHGYLARLEQLQADKEGAERLLADASAQFRGDRERDRSGLVEVLRALPLDAALVSYVHYGRMVRTPRGPNPVQTVPSYLAFILRPGQRVPDVVLLGEAAGIDELVRLWRQEAATPPSGRDSVEAYREVAARLRRTIWDPVLPRLSGKIRAFVVPDGALHLVNVATLPAPEGGYLLERAPVVHLLSAERDLVREAAATTGSGLLVLGGADFGGSPDSPSAFAPLPGSRAEAEDVASLWRTSAGSDSLGGDVVELVGSEASEGEFRRRAPGCKVLHLATHSFFLPCAPGSAGCNPLISAGLAFNGASRPLRADEMAVDDDGIMTAEEIASLDLRGVEWAVLSGCETGVGPVQAREGVLGLRRAFQVAGARDLVMSLWPIEDQQARSWIRALYVGRLSGLSAAEAVARASREVLDARRRAGALDHPFFWGAFVAAGP